MARKLTTYRKKRDFGVTPEPSPDVPAALSAKPTFMVHKHDATRLHYDLRLELDGALASWAIPRGPSFDPAERRLAVQTEDHPLAYGGFEGRIPDGEYGAGDSLIWDRGTWDTVPPGQGAAQRKKGHLHLALAGEKLEGRWHLIRTRPAGGKEQWLLFKAKDGFANPGYDVITERPESVKSGRRITRGPLRVSVRRALRPEPLELLAKIWPPMRATLSTPDAVKGPHLLEVKYDGFRALAALSGGRLALQSRNALDLSARFPGLAAALGKVTIGEAVIDGEIVALDAKGVPRFQLLQSGRTERYVAFDLLWLDGEDLRRRPLEERRELLESVLANSDPAIELARRIDLPLEEALTSARKIGLEGLMAKRRGSTYVDGKSRSWLKLKLLQAQELAVLGYTPISNGRHEVGSLLLGVYEAGEFHYAGHVGTGFTAAVRRQLLEALEEDRQERSAAPDAPRVREARWSRPRLVAQVTFGEWTRDGKLRHPSFQGLRTDKRPEECVREVPESSGERRAPTKLAARKAKARKG